MSAAAVAATAVVALVNHHSAAVNHGKSTLSPSLSPFTTNKLQHVRRYYGASQKRSSRYCLPGVKFRRPFTAVMDWQDCTVKMEVDVPTSVAYKCYSDREAIPQWMPFIYSVKNFEDNPDLSQWSLKYTAFGRDIEFSWISRNLQHIPNQKIHWRSLEDLPNRGAVRFFPKGADACVIESLSRVAAHSTRRLHSQRSQFFTSGLHQLQRIEIASQNFKIISNNYSGIVNLNHFYTTTACNSVEIPPSEHTGLSGGRDKAEETAALLREWGCDETDITKIFERQPSLRKADTEILQSKLEILSKLGITSKDLVKMVNCRPRFLSSRINILFNERLEYLETVCGSREVLLKAIVRNPSLLTYDFHNKMKPVIAMYESLGICKNDLITVLLSRPTLIPRTNLDDEKIEYIRKTGVSKESKLYKHVVALFAISRIETIREKVINLEKFGFTEDEVFNLIGRSPLILTLSVDKVQRQMTFILGNLKLSATVVLRCPFLLYFNLETVLKPRFQMACIIEDMRLVPQIKGPGLVTALRMTDKRFISAFLTCHPKDVAKELVTSYKNAKTVRRLAESSKKNLNKGFPF